MKILSDEMPEELYEKCKTSSFTLKESYEYMKCVTNGIPINEEQELRLPEEWCKDEDGISVLIHIDKNDYHRIVNGFANEDDAVMFEDLFKNGVQLHNNQQELFMNKPYIAHQACHEDKVKVLDKIRAEIEEHAKIDQNLNIDRARALCWCLDVIDKYKTESEE